jgi:hypothetical protein
MLRSRQKFQNMAVWVTKVKPPAALSGVQLPILETPGFTSIRNSGLLHAPQDCIELIIANVKSVVVVFKRFSVVEIKGQLLIDSNRSKVPRWAGILKTEDLREKTCGGLLVMRRHDSVIQRYTHDRLPWASWQAAEKRTSMLRRVHTWASSAEPKFINKFEATWW